MKKIFTLLVFTFAFTASKNSFAQVSITSADIGVVGSSIVYNNDTSYADTSSFTQTGAQASWNFSTLQNAFRDTVFFENPANTDLGGNFSTANLAVRSGGTYQYFVNQSSGLVLQGLNIGSNTGMAIDSMAVKLDPALTFLQYPTNLSSSFASSAAGRITIAYDTSFTVDGQTYAVDSIRFNVIMDQQSNIDAAGELFLPTDTLQVLRQEVMQQTRLVIEVRAVIVFNGMPIVAWVEIPTTTQNSMRNYFHRYWADNKGFPVLEISMDSSRNITGMRYQQESNIILASKTKVNKSEIKIYPSPATDFINIELTENTKVATFELVDLQGRIVKKLQLNQSISRQGIADLKSGTYFYTIRNNSGEMLGKGSLVKQ